MTLQEKDLKIFYLHYSGLIFSFYPINTGHFGSKKGSGSVTGGCVKPNTFPCSTGIFHETEGRGGHEAAEGIRAMEL